MTEFRDKLKLQNLFIAFCCFLLAVFCFVNAAIQADLIHLKPVSDDPHVASAWSGFLSGVTCALLGTLIVFLIRNIRALNNDAFLKKLYVKENDEREIMIWTKARALTFQISLLLGVVAAVIAGYFSITAAITIIIFITLQSFLGLGLVFWFKFHL